MSYPCVITLQCLLKRSDMLHFKIETVMYAFNPHVNDPTSTMRTFVFSDDTDEISVLIPERLDADYGMYTWPSAPTLAQYIWHNREQFRGKTVLEIGAGTALPGIVAAKCGAVVHLSDSESLLNCSNNSLKSCIANGLNDIKVHAITWGLFGTDVLQLPSLDIIIASDCFYDTKDFEDIISTVAFLLERNRGSEFLFTYQERSSSRTIEHLLDQWNLNGSQIHLSDFNADKPCLAGSELPGNHTIHMFKLTSKDNP
ncbi:histone-arginine methyltransferase METTL23-like [Ruditapes philippinarum]|uniref:histone-arginine methyltransferase METTL23-like n=1 Tax=Ruditapes philippinarum TaxID=129788 RepID=UPI00295A86A5|nr:histone-arginine methyltransferase METTL23-like [Ruditapes philippinarum]